MIADIQKSESGGWFILSYTRHSFCADDIGRGGARCEVRFATGTEREYYIQIEDLRSELGAALSDIRYLKTTQGANQNLREVRDKNRAAKEAKLCDHGQGMSDYCQPCGRTHSA